MSVNLNLNDILKVRFVCYNVNTTQIAINTIYYQVATLTGIFTDDQTAFAMSALFAPLYKAMMPTGGRFRGVGVQLINSVLRPVEVNSVNDDGAGTYGATPVLPNQVSAVISIRTDLSGRHRNGRIFPGFLPQGSDDNTGKMTPDYTGIVQALANSLLGPVTLTDHATGAQLKPMIRSVFPHPEPTPPDITYRAVTSMTATGRFATQRRRGQYGRINQTPF